MTSVDSLRRLPRPSRARPGEAGLTLIEGVVAAALLLLVAVGILPFFTRAMANNLQGNYMSQMTNSGIDGFERLLSLPFNSGDMTVQPGTTSTVTVDYWIHGANRWATSVGSGEIADLTRTTTIQQYNLQDVLDDGKADTALDGSTQPSFVTLKTIQVQIQNARPMAGGDTRYTTFQTF